MVKININDAIEESINNSAKEQIVNSIKDIIVFTNTDVMIQNLKDWYTSCGSLISYRTSGGRVSYINTADIYRYYKRSFVYTTLVEYLNSKKALTKYYVAIPVGGGYYTTLTRSSSGNLELSDRRYLSIDKLKRHNSYVPGGITMEEVKNSDLSWCIPFMEELND